MNLQKYTEKAQQAALAAKEMAEEANNNQIEPLHLLAALIEQPEGVVPQILARLAVDSGTLIERVREELAKLPTVYGASQTYLSGALNELAKRAESTATSMKDEY